MRLALAEAEIEKLHDIVASTTEAAKRATAAAAAAAEATTRDAAQAAAQEKAALETKVADLEHDLATAGVDLMTANRQFSEVPNQLQVVSEEATRLRESNAKLLEDLEGESSRHFLSPFLFSFVSCSF
jgi:chromosome segregation ATPase